MSYYEDSVGTKVRRFVRETFGFRGSKNLVSWVVAGGVAYYYFYLPEQKRRQEIQVRILALLHNERSAAAAAARCTVTADYARV